MSTAATASILAVDDTPANLNLLCNLLQERGYSVRPVLTGELALRAAEAEAPDLVLLDIAMPQMDGFEVCARLKANPRLAEIPVMFLTAHTDIADKVKAFSMGGVDYLTKPFQAEEIYARVATHLELARQKRSLRTSYERLAELETMRDELVHMIVHDLRTPLSALYTVLDFLHEEVAPLSERASHDVIECQKATTRMIQMVTSVLDVSKLEAAAMKVSIAPCDLLAITRAVVASMHMLAAERAIVIAPEDGAAHCLGDEALLPRVVQNLLSNAIRFTPRGGTIAITLERANGVVRLAMKDEGPGVPEAARRRIFDKFGALDRTQQGRFSTGLGLPFCRLAVEAHGGAIGVDAEDGKRGSTFWFSVPEAPT